MAQGHPLAASQREGMADPLTRNDSFGLRIILATLALVWMISIRDPGASKLNELLVRDVQFVAYPYQFRVELFEDGVATMTSPRSFDVPVTRFLSVTEPRLVGKDADHPDVMAAKTALFYPQKRAREIVQRQPEVKAVRGTPGHACALAVIAGGRTGYDHPN